MLGFILVTGIGFGIAWWIASLGLAYWRSIVGFLSGLIVSWFGGSLLVAFLLRSAELYVNPAFTGRTFWYAVFGAGWGVYQARARLKRGLKSVEPASPPKGRESARPVKDAYAEALNEIEEGRLDKGVWARAFADAGGEAERAKALYIRARAEALKGGEVWQVTEPSAAEETGSHSRVKVASPTPVKPDHVSLMLAVAVVCGIAFLVFLAFRQSTAFDPTTARPVGGNANTAIPQTRPLTQADWEKGVLTPPAGNPASVGNSQIDNFLSGKAALGKQPSQIDGFLGSDPNPSVAVPAQPPKAIYKCTGPNGVVYQAAPCGSATN